jgi:hypothetical protein
MAKEKTQQPHGYWVLFGASVLTAFIQRSQ